MITNYGFGPEATLGKWPFTPDQIRHIMVLNIPGRGNAVHPLKFAVRRILQGRYPVFTHTKPPLSLSEFKTIEAGLNDDPLVAGYVFHSRLNTVCHPESAVCHDSVALSGRIHIIGPDVNRDL